MSKSTLFVFPKHPELSIIRDRQVLCAICSAYSFFEYNEHNILIKPIDNLFKSFSNFELIMDGRVDFETLKIVLNILVDSRPGLFINHSVISDLNFDSKRHGSIEDIVLKFKDSPFKSFFSYSTKIDELSGFDPDCDPGELYLLSWYPEGNINYKELSSSLAIWEKDTNIFFTENIPISDKESIEIITIDHECDLLCVFCEIESISILINKLKSSIKDAIFLEFHPKESIIEWSNRDLPMEDVSIIDY